MPHRQLKLSDHPWTTPGFTTLVRFAKMIHSVINRLVNVYMFIGKSVLRSRLEIIFQVYQGRHIYAENLAMLSDYLTR